MENLNNRLLNAFVNNKKQDVESLIKQGADKLILIDYSNKIGGWNITINQNYILKELVYNQ